MPSALAVLLIVTAAVAQSPAQGSDTLLDAARTGDRARVASLLDGGADVNAVSRYNVSALGFAAERGHVEIVRLLVERGANVNVAESFYGFRPVDFALRGGHLDIAVFLLEHGALGAVGVLNAGIRARNIGAVRAALATKQADAAALANARQIAKQAGDATIAGLVEAAAAATPAVAPSVLTLAPALLRSYEGAYQNAANGARVVVAFNGSRLTVTAEGQPSLTLLPVEERRFIAEDLADVSVAFAGRGGIVERLSIVRGSNAVRYEREGYADATSPAPDPGARPAANTTTDPVRVAAPRGKPQPWPAFRGANAAGVADGQGAVAEWNPATSTNIKWKTPIPGLATSSPIVWGDRVIVATAASDEDSSFRTGLYGDVKPVDSLPVHSYRVYALDRTTGKDRVATGDVQGTAGHATPYQVQPCECDAGDRRPAHRHRLRIDRPDGLLFDGRHAALEEGDRRARQRLVPRSQLSVGPLELADHLQVISDPAGRSVARIVPRGVRSRDRTRAVAHDSSR